VLDAGEERARVAAEVVASCNERWGELFAGLAVESFSEEVGVAVVAGVLLDHVGEYPA
jgi:hypothetical protein